jgi:HNH endonuclease
VSPAQRRALTHRDGGCVFPGCDRPEAWCDAHHLVHWTRGGPTDLDNLALLCRRHHVTVHEGGWRIARDAATGRWNANAPP